MTITDCIYATETQLFSYFQTFTAKEKIYKPGYYLYLDNHNPITLVAHVDTLSRKHNFKLLTVNNTISVKNGGILGADDRAGVYALAKLYHLRPNILLTTGEESGGIGACMASKDLLLKDTRLMVELDRKGCNEYVYYSYTLHPKITSYIESFGYFESCGSYSDISEFPHIPAINLSCGYYHQHSQYEVLHLDELELNIKRVEQIIKNPIPKKYKTEVSEYAEYYRGYQEIKAPNRGLASKVRYYRGAEDNYGFNNE